MVDAYQGLVVQNLDLIVFFLWSLTRRGFPQGCCLDPAVARLGEGLRPMSPLHTAAPVIIVNRLLTALGNYQQTYQPYIFFTAPIINNCQTLSVLIMILIIHDPWSIIIDRQYLPSETNSVLAIINNRVPFVAMFLIRTNHHKPFLIASLRMISHHYITKHH